MNADQLAAEYERGYRDGGYQATAAHSSEQSADTKRREWIERVQPTITFDINGCEIFGLSGNFCIGKGKTFIEAIDAAMSQTKERE